MFKSLATLVKSQLDKLSALSTINKHLTFDIVPSGVRHNAPHESEVYNIVMGKVHAALHNFNEDRKASVIISLLLIY